MATYGVISDFSGMIVFLGEASSPIDACKKATAKGRCGQLGPFRLNTMGPGNQESGNWLEVTVYDVTGILEPNPNDVIDDDVSLAAMNDDTYIDAYAAQQF